MKSSISVLVTTLVAFLLILDVTALHIGHLAVVPEGAPAPEGAIELPAGMKLNARDVAQATKNARRTGRTSMIPLDESSLPDDDSAGDEAGGDEGDAGLQQHMAAVSRKGRSESLTLNPAAEAKAREVEKHRQRAALGGGDGSEDDDDSDDKLTGDGARATHAPVDEVTRLLNMLPYALAILFLAVVAVVCLIGRLSKYISSDSASYFDKSGNQSSQRAAPKMRGGGFGRRY
mmetsp:Transcript_32860/g.87169  ORF Transcript_32860/g.87169 Transcript_32860/m.87169 type:complete len:232 (-) Transcript_32860:172-867(-)